MTNVPMTPKMRASANFSKLGRYNGRIVKLVRTHFVRGRDLDSVMDTLDRYYEVANPQIYQALQRFADIRKQNAESVLIDGINLLLDENTVLDIDMDAVHARVEEILA